MPALPPLERFTLTDGRRVAHRLAPGTAPTLVFLPGYMSDMAGGKAQAVLAHAVERGQACLVLDYSGCGASDGVFAAGTLSGWRDEVLALIAARGLTRVVLVGSSMGAWLMVLIALAIPGQVAAMVGIAAAPDFTDWGIAAADQARLAAGEVLHLANPYGPGPTPIHPGFWTDAQARRLLAERVALACPVRLLHGQDDAEVPPEISLRLAAALRSDNVHVTVVKRGDHRLSRPHDVALLLRVLDALMDDLG